MFFRQLHFTDFLYAWEVGLLISLIFLPIFILHYQKIQYMPNCSFCNKKRKCARSLCYGAQKNTISAVPHSLFLSIYFACEPSLSGLAANSVRICPPKLGISLFCCRIKLHTHLIAGQTQIGKWLQDNHVLKPALHMRRKGLITTHKVYKNPKTHTDGAMKPQLTFVGGFSVTFFRLSALFVTTT